MKTIRNLTLGLLLLLSMPALAFAQADHPDEPTAPSAPTVTISTSPSGVRFATLGSVRQMRVEVFNAGGDPVYNSDFHAGNVRDWVLQGKPGQRLPDGAYLCVVTVRDLSGRLSMRQGHVVVQGGQPSLQLGDGEQATVVEPEKGFAPVAEGDAAAVTLLAHDGSSGQLVTTSGPLSFRGGDFFTGRDKELMRLSEDGALDVSGQVFARGGIRFGDGTVLTSAGGLKSHKSPLSTRDVNSDGQTAAAVSGTGTANRLSKWLDGAGTLADSSIYEDAAGNLGVGTSAPGGVLDLQRGSSGDILQRFWNTGTGGTKLRYVAATGATSQLQLTDNSEWLASIAGNNQTGLQFRVRPTGSANTEAALNQSAVLTLARGGNVGVGTTNPDVNFRLDVAGNLHVSGSAVVDGNIAAKYQDIAEWVPARRQMAAGTVVVVARTHANTVEPSARAYETRVAGVVSSQPGVILGEAGEGKALIATSGRVKVRVDATRRPIRIGDLIVTGTKPGVGMKSLPLKVGGKRLHRPGTIIGKALEALAGGEGEILVLLSLQ